MALWTRENESAGRTDVTQDIVSWNTQLRNSVVVAVRGHCWGKGVKGGREAKECQGWGSDAPLTWVLIGASCRPTLGRKGRLSH